MDLIRLFVETAFCRVDQAPPVRGSCPRSRSLLISEAQFVESARIEHTELSDDQIRLIYQLFRDDWSTDDKSGRKNIFHSLIHFTRPMLVVGQHMPCLVFNNLFRWYEIAQIVGEELLVCAFLADRERFPGSHQERTHFAWSTILPTDNMELNDRIRRGEAADLHQHLKASTDVFGISWICLMNHVMHRMRHFSKLYAASQHAQASQVYAHYIEAAAIRLQLYRQVVLGKPLDRNAIYEACRKAQYGDVSALQSAIHLEQNRHDGSGQLDYACAPRTRETDLFTGERRLLYRTLRTIYETGDPVLTALLHNYLLTKTKIRQHLVQLNKNAGFANFDRYEQRKEVFIEPYPRYANLLKSLPAYEAMQQHGVHYLETRVAPRAPFRSLCAAHRETKRLLERHLTGEQRSRCQLIYHFIKKEDKEALSGYVPRNHRVRMEIRNQAIALQALLDRSEGFAGIDAANSEFFCRPEVFAHAYRYLSHNDIRRTYHVGEDYFDLTDGLRAISEACFLLDLQAGDRLGHCIALGMDPQHYYQTHRFHIPLPQQVLLDNLVWLHFTAQHGNVVLPPRIEGLIRERYRDLSGMYGSPPMEDYYYSMQLRGNSPYHESLHPGAHILRDWESAALDRRKRIRESWENEDIRRLFTKYHFNARVRAEGAKVVDFKVPACYPEVIRQMQDQLMIQLSKRRIAIECCPTSNLKIGRLERYEHHPIFRMWPLERDRRLSPTVTVNTDDLGIFATSLDNEYALLLLALLKQKDDGLQLKYTRLQALEWVEELVRNSRVFRFAAGDECKRQPPERAAASPWQ